MLRADASGPIMHAMLAAILAVGSELLGTDRLDTNSLALSACLRRFGIPVGRKSIVGDSVAQIAAELERLRADHEIVIVTGGLGPTTDDVTREAVAEATGRRLDSNPELLAELEAKFARLSKRMAASNRKQADLIEGAVVLRNPRGTAPGQRLDLDGATIFLFPGVPEELDFLIHSELEPWLADRMQDEELEELVLRVACLAESDLEERLLPVYAQFGKDAIAVLASPGDIQVRAVARGKRVERARRLGAVRSALVESIGMAAYGEGAKDRKSVV